jgi:hypothetical protein
MKSGGSFKTTHGESFAKTRTPEYVAWTNIQQRCTNASGPDFERYGGAGITVCKRWTDSYEAFLADMGRRPSAKHSIDRLDGAKGYEPGNCRWATPTEQARNQKSNRLLTVNGETMCLAAWSERSGIDSALIRKRIDDLGWSVEAAVSTPVGPQRFDFRGRFMTYDEIESETGIPSETLRRRIPRHGSVEAAIAAYHSNSRGKRAA